MTQSKPQQPSSKHHYIPEFYLKQWVGPETGRLIEFARRWDGSIRARETAPGGTGYEYNLNTLRGFPPHLAQQVEEGFFQTIDGLARDALLHLSSGGNASDWNLPMQSAWSRFILSLLLRCPEDLILLRDHWRTLYVDPDSEVKAQYDNLPEEQKQENFEDLLRNTPEAILERGFFKALLTLIDNANVGGFINGMMWSVLRLDQAKYDLLTSDRPVLRTNGLDTESGHLLVPAAPRTLFIATRNRQTLRMIRDMGVNTVVKAVNRATVCSAKKFVYATNTSQEVFIQRHFGTVPQPRLAESILAGIRRREAQQQNGNAQPLATSRRLRGL